MDRIIEIMLSKIECDKHSVRAVITNEDVQGLTSSIIRLGILSPLVVQKDGDKYVIVTGHRRFRAACLANLKSVPCIIRDVSEAELKETVFAENFFRADLSPVEQAAAIKDVMDTGAMTVEQVAVGFHRSEHWVVRQVDMLGWPDDVLAAVHAGSVSVAAASNLALITDDVYRSFLMRNATESGCTARISAAWLQAWRCETPPEAAIQAEPVPESSVATPCVPQAPCICCAEIQRTDALSSVLVCGNCINAFRTAAG